MKLQVIAIILAASLGFVLGILSRDSVSFLSQISQGQAIFATVFAGFITLSSAFVSNYLERERERKRRKDERNELRNALLDSIIAEIETATICYIIACEGFEDHFQIIENYANKIVPHYKQRLELFSELLTKLPPDRYQNLEQPEVPTTTESWYPQVTIHVYDKVIDNLMMIDKDVIRELLNVYTNLMNNNEKKNQDIPIESVIHKRDTLKNILYSQTVSQILLLRVLSGKRSYQLSDHIADRGQPIVDWIVEK